MKKIFNIFLLFLVSCSLYLSTAYAVDAASLGFDKASYNVGVGDTIQVQVVVNPGPEQITSVDAYIKYDSSIINAQTVTQGSYFPTVLNDLTTGRVYVAGLVDNPSDFRTGTGTIATITFKAVADGTITLAYNCQSGATDTSKIIKNDINSTNIITCTENGTAGVVVGTGVSASGGTATASATQSANVAQLPQSGVLENITSFAISGLALVLIGGMLQFIRKV